MVRDLIPVSVRILHVTMNLRIIPIRASADVAKFVEFAYFPSDYFTVDVLYCFNHSVFTGIIFKSNRRDASL